MLPRGINLFTHQEEVIEKLRTGSILCGGVGSGKTLTSISYFYLKERPKDLYVITTAKKRDSLDWNKEAAKFAICRDRTCSIDNIQLTVDSWNNIKKYEKIENCFFIFDEQRVVGSGSWVKSFLKITKQNNWILLTATPGDSWMDYIPVFVANGFFKNRTEFIRSHVVYNTHIKFPKVDHYVEEGKLIRLKNRITVTMDYKSPTKIIKTDILVKHDLEKMELVFKWRWNPYTQRPIKDVSELFFTMRKVANIDSSRLEVIKDLLIKHRKIIVFYNFNYELENLRELRSVSTIAEYNGHKHEEIPNTDSWIYLVQYMSGSEGWNCIETNTVIFYSLNYSFKIMKQAAGRIDRLNTPFDKLYYYYIKSDSFIDKAISKALKNKKNFNESKYDKEVAAETWPIIEGE